MLEHKAALTQIAELFRLENDPAQMEAVIPTYEDLFRHIRKLREIDLGDIEPAVGFDPERR